MPALLDVEQPARRSAQLAGQTLSDRYRVKHLIHSSAMSHVYEGEDAVRGRRVAIKVMRDEDQTDVRPICRFFLEARLGKRLAASPYCVRVTDIGFTDQAVPYFVMDYLVGEDLASYLHRRKSTSFEHAIEVVLELCRAVADLHAAGVVHRDIKPSNVFILQDGSVRLIDFGVCKSTLDDLSLTTTGTLVGSLPYVPPERWLDPDDARLCGDVWALAVVLYELMAGRVPFRAQPREALQQAILNEDVDVQFKGAEDCPEIQTVLRVALHKDPGYRYGTVPDFAAALSRAAFDAGLRADPDWRGEPPEDAGIEEGGAPNVEAPEASLALRAEPGAEPGTRNGERAPATRQRAMIAALIVLALTAALLLFAARGPAPLEVRPSIAVAAVSSRPDDAPTPQGAVSAATVIAPHAPAPSLKQRATALPPHARTPAARVPASSAAPVSAAPLPPPADPEFPGAARTAAPTTPPPRRSAAQPALDVTPSDLTHF